MRKIDVAMQLGCDYQPFLAGVVQAYERDGQEIGGHTRRAVDGMKASLRDLVELDDPFVQTRLRVMDQLFAERDGEAYTGDHVDSGAPDFSRHLTGRLLRATRRQWVDFGVWYQGRIGELGQQLKTDRDTIVELALGRISLLREAGVVPRMAVPLIERSIDWTGPLKPLGSIESAANQHDGYCDTNGIGVANIYRLENPPAVISLEMQQVTLHEYIHGVGHVGDGTRGFMGAIDMETPQYNRWYEEAYVSTLTDAGMRIRSNPIADQYIRRHYPLEGRFQELVRAASSIAFDLADESAAYFAANRRRPTARQHIARALYAGVNELFPEYRGEAWNRINEDYANEKFRDRRTLYMAEMVMVAESRLYPGDSTDA